MSGPKINNPSGQPRVSSPQPQQQVQRQQQMQTATAQPEYQRGGFSGESQFDVQRQPVPALRNFVQADKARPVREPLHAMQKRLEPLVDMQVEEVKEVMEDLGLKPDDLTFVFAWNTKPDAEVRCMYCGRIGCGYRPQANIMKNQEFNLIEDAKVAADMLATKLGVSLGEIVYDDESVLVIREPSKADGGDESAQTLQRFRDFVDRRDYPDTTDRAWQQQQLAKWTPDKPYRKVVGQADDLGMLLTSQKLLQAFEPEPGKKPVRVLLVGTSQLPETQYASYEQELRDLQVMPTGMAIGRKAAEIAPRMFSETMQIAVPHEAVEKIGAVLSDTLEENLDKR